MKKLLIAITLIWISASSAFTQAPYSLTSTQPSNRAVNVDLSTTIRFTFNQAIPLHYTATEIDEFVDVSPRSDLTIHSVTISLDRKSLEYQVTHTANKDYHWTVTGPYPIDSFKLLQYTTAASFGQGSVSGKIGLPSEATGIGFNYGYVFLVHDANLDPWDDVHRYAGIATLGADGSYSITGVRAGTYHAYALVTSNPTDEENSDVYFGKFGIPISVSDPVQNVNFQLNSLDQAFQSNHSHLKLAEIRQSVNSVLPNAGLKSIFGFQMLQNDDKPNGTSQFWTYLWYDNTTERSMAAMMNSGFVDVEEIEDQGLATLPYLPLNMISSSQAVQVVMQEGAEAFVNRMPEDAMIIVMHMAGTDITQYGYEGEIPTDPFWFINIVSVYSSPAGSVTEVYYALVDAVTGVVIDKTPTSIDKPTERDETPGSISLGQNYPNPFNPSTVIGFTVGTQDLASVRTKLSVFDLLGREVAVLVDGVMPAGEHSVRFDASGLSSGVYLYRLQAGNQVETRRMTLVK